MRGYPQFSFWISITLVKIYIPCVIINQGKNTIELVGTILNGFLASKVMVTVNVRHHTVKVNVFPIVADRILSN